MAWQMTHVTHDELIQGAKPAESTQFSPAELNFCRINSLRDLTRSLRVQELEQKKREAGGSGSKRNRSF